MGYFSTYHGLCESTVLLHAWVIAGHVTLIASWHLFYEVNYEVLTLGQRSQESGQGRP